LELARQGLDVAAVSADTSKSMFTVLLREEFPHRFIDTGVAEQNMMMVAAGLAAAGKIAFAASYSVFTSMRCCEQLRTFAAYPDLNVNVIAGIGGFSAGIEGVTHVATEDLGIMRCLANMTVIAPSDAAATGMAVKAAALRSGPSYIRVGRDPSPVLFNDAYPFEIGVPVLHRNGSDITLAATGLVLAEVLRAAEQLAAAGIQAEVVEVHTLKPMLRSEVILDSVKKTGSIVTVEEHNVIGGLATVVSEILAGKGSCTMMHLGLQDRYAESATPQELLRKYGIDADGIVKAAEETLRGGKACIR
jgi:transketolase